MKPKVKKLSVYHCWKSSENPVRSAWIKFFSVGMGYRYTERNCMHSEIDYWSVEINSLGVETDYLSAETDYKGK